jgi:hypothetical protein
MGTSYYPNVPWKPQKQYFFSQQNLTRHFTWTCWVFVFDKATYIWMHSSENIKSYMITLPHTYTVMWPMHLFSPSYVCEICWCLTSYSLLINKSMRSWHSVFSCMSYGWPVALITFLWRLGRALEFPRWQCTGTPYRHNCKKITMMSIVMTCHPNHQTLI